MTAKDMLLFSTENGEIYQCALFGRLVLTFKGYWIVFDAEGFIRFRNQVVRLATCTVGRRMFVSEGLRLIGENDGIVLRLGPAEAEELVWLLDSAQYMLYAQKPDIQEGVVREPIEGNTQPLRLNEVGKERPDTWKETSPIKFEKVARSCIF